MTPTPTNRHTEQRRLVLAALKLSDRPLTAEEVARAVRRARVSVSTVYRNLDVLTERGEIFRFTAPDGTHRFAGAPRSIVYRRCGVCSSVEELDADDVTAFFQRQYPRHEVRAATVYLQGTCGACAGCGERQGGPRG